MINSNPVMTGQQLPEQSQLSILPAGPRMWAARGDFAEHAFTSVHELNKLTE